MKKPIGISMTEGAPWRHTVRFAVPVLAGALLQQLYSTVDMLIVGRFTGEKVYPQLNLLFLDFDSGTSEANVFIGVCLLFPGWEYFIPKLGMFCSQGGKKYYCLISGEYCEIRACC